MDNDDPQITLQPQSKFPWPLVAIIVAGLILAAFIYYLPSQPKVARNNGANAEAPAQPFDQMLKFENVNVVPAPTGGQAYLVGDVVNSSGKKVDGITVNVALRDAQGNVVQQQTQTVQAIAGKNDRTEPKALSETPIGSEQTAAIQIPLQGLPVTWNHQVPEITIEHVSFVGQTIADVAPKGVNDTLRKRANPKLPASDVTTGGQKPAKPNPQQPQ